MYAYLFSDNCIVKASPKSPNKTDENVCQDITRK